MDYFVLKITVSPTRFDEIRKVVDNIDNYHPESSSFLELDIFTRRIVGIIFEFYKLWDKVRSEECPYSTETYVDNNALDEESHIDYNSTFGIKRITARTENNIEFYIDNINEIQEVISKEP